MAHGKADDSNLAHGHDADDGQVHAHLSSVGFYVAILGIPMMLTLLVTVAVGLSGSPSGRLNLAVAIVIASIKATLVVMFFMHLKYDNRFHATIVISSILFIGVFFAYTMNDTDRQARRRMVTTQGIAGAPVRADVQAPGGMLPARLRASAATSGALGSLLRRRAPTRRSSRTTRKPTRKPPPLRRARPPAKYPSRSESVEQ